MRCSHSAAAMRMIPQYNRLSVIDMFAERIRFQFSFAHCEVYLSEDTSVRYNVTNPSPIPCDPS